MIRAVGLASLEAHEIPLLLVLTDPSTEYCGNPEPQLMAARKCLAEHPFGNLKWLMGLPPFLLRGLAGARIEMALAVTAYNLKRVIKILGVPYLPAQLKAA